MPAELSILFLCRYWNLDFYKFKGTLICTPRTQNLLINAIILHFLDLTFKKTFDAQSKVSRHKKNFSTQKLILIHHTAHVFFFFFQIIERKHINFIFMKICIGKLKKYTPKVITIRLAHNFFSLHMRYNLLIMFFISLIIRSKCYNTLCSTRSRARLKLQAAVFSFWSLFQL